MSCARQMRYRGPRLQVRDAAALRLAREEQRWTQRAMAERCGTSQSTIWLVETGQIVRLQEPVARAICEFLGLELAEMFVVGDTALDIPA